MEIINNENTKINESDIQCSIFKYYVRKMITFRVHINCSQTHISCTLVHLCEKTLLQPL